MHARRETMHKLAAMTGDWITLHPILKTHNTQVQCNSLRRSDPFATSKSRKYGRTYLTRIARVCRYTYLTPPSMSAPYSGRKEEDHGLVHKFNDCVDQISNCWYHICAFLELVFLQP